MKRIITLLAVACIYLITCLQCSVNRNLSNDKPIIGISTGFSNSKSSVGDTYITAVMKAGGVPVLIPLVRDKRMAEELVAMIDGLVMTGGEDVDPAYYGETILNATVYVNGPRDTSDFLLMEAARKKGIPMLGICRGEQELNVFYGGTLVQDIPSQVNTCIAHRQSEPSSVGTHLVYFEPGTQLRNLLGVDSIWVNTFHHQAVNKLAPEFKVSARAADGVIEAFESTDPKVNILCVQFHPEGFIYSGNETLLPIFTDFVRKAGSHH